MADLQQIASDPDFAKLPLPEKRKVLSHYFPDYAKLPDAEQIRAIQKLNPDYQRQEGQSTFELSTGVKPTVAGVGIHSVKEFGGGLWDAVKGFGSLFSSERRPEEGKDDSFGSWIQSRAVVRAGRGIWDALKQAPEVPGAIRDLYNSPDHGNAAVAMQVPRALGQYAGSELIGKGISKIGGVPKAVVRAPGAIQEGMQRYTAGVGPNAAADLVEDTRTARAEELGRIQKKNAELHAKYQEDVVEANRARRQAEQAHAAAVDKAAKEHAAAELEKAKAYEEKVARQKDIFEKRVARQQRAIAKQHRDIDAANAEAQAEHAEAVKRTEKFNEEQKGAVGRRAELGNKLNTDSTALGQRLRDFHKAVKAKAKSLYTPVDKATAGETIPSEDASALVTHAENSILQGSEESIKQFREIVSWAKEGAKRLPDEQGESGPVKAYMDEGGTLGSETIGPDPIPISDARGFVTEIMDAVNNRPGLLGDVRRALASVGTGLKAKVMKVYDDAGVGDQARAADQFYAQMKQTFDNMKSIKTRQGSPVARALRAPQDVPTYIRDPFINPDYGAKALSQIKAYEADPELGAQAKEIVSSVEQIVKDETERNTLPKAAKVKEAPEAPKAKPYPEAPEPIDQPYPIKPPKPEPFEPPQLKLPKEAQPPKYPKYADDFPEPPSTEELAKQLREIKQQKVRAKSKQFTEMNKWDAIAAGYGIKEIARGVFPKAWAYILGHAGVGKLLTLPKVNAWLTEVTPTDIAILEKLYEHNPEGKAEAQEAMTEAIIRGGKAPRLKYLMNFLTKPQISKILHRFVGASTAGQAEGARKQSEADSAAEDASVPAQ